MHGHASCVILVRLRPPLRLVSGWVGGEAGVICVAAAQLVCLSRVSLAPPCLHELGRPALGEAVEAIQCSHQLPSLSS